MPRSFLRAVLWTALLNQVACLNPTGLCWKDEHCAPATCDRQTHHCRDGAGDGGSGDLGAACTQAAGTAQRLVVTFTAAPVPASGDHFGAALAMLGDTLFVGAPRHQSVALTTGGVYAISGLSGTTGVAQALLGPATPKGGEFMGLTLATAADILLAGPDLTQGGSQEVVHLFHKSAGVWGSGQAIKVASLMGFGSALAYDGTGPAFIGAPANIDVASTQGAVYPLDVTTGTLQSPVYAKAGQASGRFGAMLALTPSTLLVAAPSENIGQAKAGAVYTVARSPLGLGAEAPYGPMPAKANAQFGTAMAIVGNTLLVGSGIGSMTNSAYFFQRASATAPFTFQATLSSPAPSPGYFGFTVALLSETVAAIGDTGVDTGLGAVYLYDLTQPDATLGRRLIQTVVAADRPANADFSLALAAGGSTLFVGAPSAPPAGAVYVISCQ